MNENNEKKIEKIFRQEIEIPYHVKNTIKKTLNIASNKNKLLKNNIIKTVLATSTCCLMLTGIVFAKDIKNYVSSLLEINKGVDTAIENGYVYKNDEPETTLDTGDIKVNFRILEIVMDDYNLDIQLSLDSFYTLNFKEYNKITLQDMVVYDENYNIIFFDNIEVLKEFLKGQDKEYSEKELKEKCINASMNCFMEYPGKGGVDIKCKLSGTTFPKSKKINIMIKTINVYKDGGNKEDVKTVTGEWNASTSIPEEFYKRENTLYKCTYCSEPGIDKNKVTGILSNTAFKVKIDEIKTDKIDFGLLNNTTNPKKISDLIAIQKEYIETSDGRKFETENADGNAGYSVGIGEDVVNGYHQTFSLTKFDAVDDIKIHMFTNKNEEITIILNKEDTK